MIIVFVGYCYEGSEYIIYKIPIIPVPKLFRYQVFFLLWIPKSFENPVTEFQGNDRFLNNSKIAF